MQNNENIMSQFFASVPKKQPKSYEIELGQNEGAYKEELLIRYGDNTINHMMNNKKNHGTKLALEDIMKMNEQLKPFQERPNYQGQSYAVLCDEVEDDFGKMDDRNAYLTKYEEELRVGIDEMTESIFKLFDDTQLEFSPKLLEKFADLKKAISAQKDQNANLVNNFFINFL